MNWWGSGLIPLILYSTAGGAIGQENAILTEDNKELLTENGKVLLTEED